MQTRTTVKKMKESVPTFSADHATLLEVLRLMNHLKGAGIPDSPFNLSSKENNGTGIESQIINRYFGDNASISQTLYQVLYAACEINGLAGPASIGNPQALKGVSSIPGANGSATDHTRRMEE